uniref:Fatty acyl-CoA reductase n=1 Tax=Brassica oleracea TaxID=3712 RepID=A0A3P6ASM1_BRAOL|nr:unnamed protein product [Brassica oleracea]
MEPSCVQFLENKTVLVTGASGFLAKVFVERVLRLQPKVRRLYLLVRASDNKAAKQRLHSEVFEKDLFRVLRKNVGDECLNALISEKVVPIPGDISLNNMGVIRDSNLLQDMMQEIDIIVNSAATTRFDERYDVALGINTFGPLNILNFAKKCAKPQLLLHVSTAFVCGERSGLILEKPFAMGESLNGKNKVDIDAEMLLVAKLYGWPNTYVFTKAMGEMLIGYCRESMPIVIIRPTIITSTFSDPFPGWIESIKTIDSVIVSFRKGLLKCFLVDDMAVCDLIPVDMVANAMIVTAAEHSRESGSHTIYHVGSSYQNPVMYKQIYEILNRFFLASPLLGRNGLPIVPNVKIFPTMARFRVYTSLRYKLPLQILRFLRLIFPSQLGEKYEVHNRRFYIAMRMVKLYRPYVIFKGIFDDRNLERLRIKNEGTEIDKLIGSIKCIDWEDYFMNIHIRGLITHVLKK